MRWLDGITDSTDMSLSKLPDGQRSLACCSPWGHKESDMTELKKLSTLWAIMIVKSLTIRGAYRHS